MNDPIVIGIIIVTTGLWVLFMMVCIVLVLRDTIRHRGRWGVNFGSVCCPVCDKPMPAVRIPKNTRQVLWGGWTCSDCGCEIDKWGQEVY